MVLLMSSIDDFLILLLIAQFFVGVIQLVLALIQTIIRFNKKVPIGKLRIYWIMVGIYFLGGFFVWATVSQIHGMEALGWTWFLSAWGIAIYYTIEGWR